MSASDESNASATPRSTEPGSELVQRVDALCKARGFAHIGIAPARQSENAREFIDWLADGQHGEMAWLESHVDQRIDPTVKLPGARAVICVLDSYESPDAQFVHDPFAGRIARYAHGDDYHASMKARLHAVADELRSAFSDHAFITCVDTAPVLERDQAAAAGLGFQAKNTMLIRPGMGSYFFVGEIITTLDLPLTQDLVPDHCGTCTRCLDACPTDALTPYALDARRCISYHTIEQRSPIDEQFYDGIGSWIFGCDICQEVCPHNGHADRRESWPTNYPVRQASFDLLTVLNWTPEDRARALKGSAIKRAKLWMLKRNAIIAAGNALADAPNSALLGRITQLAADDHEHSVVRHTAQRVLERLADPNQAPA